MKSVYGFRSHVSAWDAAGGLWLDTVLGRKNGQNPVPNSEVSLHYFMLIFVPQARDSTSVIFGVLQYKVQFLTALDRGSSLLRLALRHPQVSTSWCEPIISLKPTRLSGSSLKATTTQTPGRPQCQRHPKCRILSSFASKIQPRVLLIPNFHYLLSLLFSL